MTCGILLSVIYSFACISAFMHCSDAYENENESFTWNVNNNWV